MSRIGLFGAVVCVVMLCACSSGTVDTDGSSAASASGGDAPCDGACPVDVPRDVDKSKCRVQLCDTSTMACDVYVYFPGASCNAGTGVCDDAGNCASAPEGS